ncbi:MAG: hypothetical protein VW405_03165 [Rhodospirillaceae bacterium]
MNPLRVVKIFGKANRLLSLLQQGTQSYERTHDMSKSLFVSKTFWFNIVTAAVELTGVLPVPQGAATAVVAVGNVVLRLLTNQPAHIVAK